MSGVELRVDVAGLAGVGKRLERLAGLDKRGLLETIGVVVESQTRRRISEDKASADGEDWEDWSDAYKKTRHSGHKLLESDGDLLDSIDYKIGRDEVRIGTNLIYGATHQLGREEDGIPARPFLGLSGGDRREIIEVVEDYLKRVVG